MPQNQANAFWLILSITYFRIIYPSWDNQFVQNEMLITSDSDKSGKINELKAIVVPLLWIENIGDITYLFEKLDVDFVESN